MPNWYKEIANNIVEKARYRAVFPIDVMVNESGDEDRNKNEVYQIVQDTLNNTPLTNFWLEMGDIERHSGT
ncbi:MAG: hypothetical protein J7L15_08600 [Clostridiales bacterium]|nr:hypothetical protein [Clostridiales bacterium]